TTSNSGGELRAQLNRVGSAEDFSGGDTFVVKDLTQAGVHVVNLGLGLADNGEMDHVTIDGRQVADQAAIAMNGDLVNVVGLTYDVNVSNSGIAEDELTF